MFSPTDFRELFQPNYCERRIWLNANRPELAVKDVAFIEMVQEKGMVVEKVHVETVGPIKEPDYEPGDMPSGFQETLKLIKSRIPIIYQGVLISTDEKYSAIPDLLILDDKTEQYKVRDIKLAKNIENHPEIELGIGLSKAIADEILGYPVITEIITGDGMLISPFTPPDKSYVFSVAEKIMSLETQPTEPVEPEGWSKCKDCYYYDYCFGKAWDNRSICAISGIEKGMIWALWERGISTWDDVIKLGIDELINTQFQRGPKIQRIGPTRGSKLFNQTRCLVEQSFKKKQDISFPNGSGDRNRPVVIFDVENTVFDEIDVDVDVYIWGIMTILPDETKLQSTVIAPPCEDGDKEGWIQFLEAMGKIFQKHGDIPIIHFSSHEITKINNYVDAYGDKDGIANRIKANMWDLYRSVVNSVILPVSSYGLKQIEKFVGFERSQEEYGGSWSIVKYNQYLQAPDEETAKTILDEIRTYNREDLMATYAVYKWLEDNLY